MTDYEIVKRSNSADVEIRLVSGVYEVYADGESIVRTRVFASAVAEFEDAVYSRTAKKRSRIAAERANGAYREMANENGAQRSSRAQRGGKGGRGGV